MTNYGKLFRSPKKPRPVKGRYVEDWGDCCDEEFVRALKPLTGRLRKAKSLWTVSPKEAKQLVVDHFLNRPGPRWAFDFRKKRAAAMPSRNFFFDQVVDLEKAKHSLRYEFYDYNLSGNYHKLTKHPDFDLAEVRDVGTAGWLTLSFAYWGLFPAAGYAITRDKRYAKVFARCWKSWFDLIPTRATDRGLNQWSSFNTRDPGAVDICMNVGRRALVLTDVLYSGLLSVVSTDLAFEVLKYQWFVCELFEKAYDARNGRPVFGRGNHNLFDRGTVPFCLGVMFPEFPCAATLQRVGRRDIRDHASDPVTGAIRPDGTSWEHSLRYAWYAAGMFRQPIELARLNKRPLLSKREEGRVAEFLDTFADMTAPDGSGIPYGDCQPPRQGCHLELARSLYSGTRAEAAGKKLGVLTQVHAPSRKASPVKGPLVAARFFEESGILVTRTGWRKDDSLLFVTAEPRAAYSGHSHHDFGSFQLWADGVPIVYDSATWAYRINEIVPAERGYYYSAFSHNLLTMEGYRPAKVFRRMGDVNDWWGDSDNPPVKTKALDLDGPRGRMVLQHHAYPGIVVRRAYEFDLEQKWVEIKDNVKADKVKSREFRQWLHLDYGARAEKAGARAVLISHQGVRARCEWAGTVPFKPRVERSRELDRAAEVFQMGQPLRVFSEVLTRKTLFELSCRIEWND